MGRRAGGRPGQRLVRAAVAAAHAIRTQIFNAQCNIQLHGGIGYTWEHDAHMYLRRARTLAAIMGDGADPLFDVVDGQRTGQAHGASFALPEEAEQFRKAAREAVATLRSLPTEQQRDFLVDSGYLVPHWPTPWGKAAGVLEQLVIEEEFGSGGGAKRRGSRRRSTARHGHHRLGHAHHRPGGQRRPTRHGGSSRCCAAR